MPKLIKSVVEKLDQPGWYRDSELKGFCVRVRRNADGRLSKIYAVNGRARGRQMIVTVTIGRHGVITAENARIEAIKILAELAQGENPNIQVKESREALRKRDEKQELLSKLQQKTLADLLGDYLKSRSLKEKSATDYVRFTKRCVGDWLNTPIVKITRDMVQERHLQLSAEHPAQANYTMRVQRALFKYAIAVYEDEDGKPLLTLNPVDRLRQARLWNRVPRRQRIVKPGQLGE